MVGHAGLRCDAWPLSSVLMPDERVPFVRDLMRLVLQSINQSMNSDYQITHVVKRYIRS